MAPLGRDALTQLGSCHQLSAQGSTGWGVSHAGGSYRWDSPSTQLSLTAGDLGGGGGVLTGARKDALCSLTHNAGSHRAQQQWGCVPVTPGGDGTHHPVAPSQRGPGLALMSCPDAAKLWDKGRWHLVPQVPQALLSPQPEPS